MCNQMKNIDLFVQKQQLHHYIIWYSFCFLLSSKYGFKYYISHFNYILFYWIIIIIDILQLKKIRITIEKPQFFKFLSAEDKSLYKL